MPSTIKQYRPSFATGHEPQTITFSSLEELLSIDFVSNFRDPWQDKPSFIDPDFHQFSISTEDRDDYVLMAEFKDGQSWYVVGFIDKPDHIKDLPEWKPKYKQKEEK